MSEKKKKVSKQVVLKLSYPVEWGEETVEELTFRRPTGADIEGLSAKPDMKQLLQIGARCASVTPALVKRLDAEDCLKIVEVVGDFLDNSQKTGDNAW